MKSLNIADLFCGAGGTSSGAIEAISALGYRPQLTAVNHWPIAIDTHTFNHPDARHLCTSIDDVNPRTLYKRRELDVLWASPECTHHSNARGGKPVNEQSRATAFCVPRWMDAIEPDVVLVENVPEFRKWGPKKNGAAFKSWFEMCCNAGPGYRGGHEVFVAADYGDPTTRARVFVQFQRRGKIVWPDPTHAEDGAGGLAPWVPARDIIDWNTPGQSIFERERPLSPKTIKRIFEGLKKFGLRAFITPGHGERPTQTPRTHSIDEPLPAVTAGGHLHLCQPFILSAGGPECPARPVSLPMGTVLTRDHRALASPYLVKFRGTNNAADLDQPVPTITASGNHLGLAEPFLIHAAHGGNRRARGIDEPLPTIAGNRGDMALCEPSLLPQGGGGALRPVSEPAPTIHCDGAVALVEPFLVTYYGTGGARSTRRPLDTVSTKDRFGLVRPVVIVNGERYLLDIRFRMLQPRELAAAQGFHPDYRFAGNKTEQVKQIGNAVPRNLARALVLAAFGQRSDVAKMMSAAA